MGGDLTTDAGLIEAFDRAFVGVLVALTALMAITLLAVPKRVAGGHAAGHHH